MAASLVRSQHTPWQAWCSLQSLYPRMEALASRLAELEALAVPGNVRLFTCALPSTWTTLAGLASEASARVADALRSAAVSGAILVNTPDDYYDWTLEKRGVLLRCSPSNLCKCIILENKAALLAAEECSPSDWRKSRWFCVSLQYVTKLDMPLLEESLRNASGLPRLSRRAVHLQVAPESECVDMTGFVKNAITPFGCRGPPIPVILSAAALRTCPAYIWLGGGEVSAKLRIPVKEFIRSLNVSVLHCTVDNSGDESD